MAAPSARVWAVPAFLEYVHPPLTDETVEAAERQLGVTLPAAYIALLRVQNGGYTEVTLPESVQTQIWGIGSKFPSILDGSLWDRSSEYAGEVWLPPVAEKLIPFDGDGHWYFCFDFRSGGPDAEPAVAFVDLECEREERVADSFGAFLHLLKRDFGDHLMVGLSHVSADEAATILERELGVTFGKPDDFAHGYPTRSAKVRAGDPPDWIWIDPNLVPSGFSRSSGRTVHAATNTDLRFPDHPDSETIVTCSTHAAQSVMAALQRTGLAPQPINVP